MKPHEFANCTYREAFLFTKSYKKEKENILKNNIILLENMTDKMIKIGSTAKKPVYTRIIDNYKELFKEEHEQMIKDGNITLMDNEDKRKFIMELQEEEKRGTKL